MLPGGSCTTDLGYNQSANNSKGISVLNSKAEFFLLMKSNVIASESLKTFGIKQPFSPRCQMPRSINTDGPFLLHFLSSLTVGYTAMLQ